MFAAQPTYKAVISDTFTAISMKTAVAWNIKLYIKIDRCQCSGETVA